VLSRTPSLLEAFELAAEKQNLQFFKEKLTIIKGRESLPNEISPTTKKEEGEEEDARRAIEEALDEIIRKTSEDSDSKLESVEPPQVDELVRLLGCPLFPSLACGV
jgi:hypothetical protein